MKTVYTALAIGAFTVVSASAQTYTLTDANLTYDYATATVPTDNNTTFTASTCASDNTWGTNWNYSIAGSSAGQVIDDAGHGSYTPNAAGSVINQSITDLDGNVGINVDMLDLATSTGPENGNVLHTLTVTNNTGATLDISIYRYVDFDVGGTFGDDSVTADSGQLPNGDVRLSVTDPVNCVCAELYAVGADFFEVSTFLGPSSTLINSGSNLTNTGLPFTNNDFSGSVQWILSIPDGQSASVSCTTGHNDAFSGNATSITQSGVAVGSNGGMTLSATGGLLGDSVTVDIANAPPTSATADILISFTATPVQVPFEGLQLMLGSPVVTTAQVALTGGMGSITFAIGCSSNLAGLPLALQALTVDTGSPANLPIGNSNNLLVIVGD